MLFSIAMTLSRFVGDGIVAQFGNRIVLTLGGVTALLGWCGLLLAPVAWIGLVSFVFVGLGAANIVPILFRLAGTQHTMPEGLAVAALTTAGYAGMLTGPAVIGFLSKGISCAYVRREEFYLAHTLCSRRHNCGVRGHALRLQP
jgi:hypothetical protein